MKARIVSQVQHLGPENWGTSVVLNNGAEFRCDVPDLSLGEEIEVHPNGSIDRASKDGKVFTFNPTWTRLAD